MAHEVDAGDGFDDTVFGRQIIHCPQVSLLDDFRRPLRVQIFVQQIVEAGISLGLVVMLFDVRSVMVMVKVIAIAIAIILLFLYHAIFGLSLARLGSRTNLGDTGLLPLRRRQQRGHQTTTERMLTPSCRSDELALSAATSSRSSSSAGGLGRLRFRGAMAKTCSSLSHRSDGQPAEEEGTAG